MINYIYAININTICWIGWMWVVTVVELTRFKYPETSNCYRCEGKLKNKF